MIGGIAQRVCTKCRCTKPVDHFTRKTHHWCRECRRENSRAHSYNKGRKRTEEQSRKRAAEGRLLRLLGAS